MGLLSEQSLDAKNAFVDPEPETKLKNGMQINYQAPIKILVTDEGQKTELVTTSVTVGEALQANNFSLSPLDEIFPGVSAGIYSGLEVVIERVEEGEITREEEISFSQIVQGDPDVLYGVEKVTQKGKPGLAEVTYRVRIRDGKEEFRQRLSSQVLEEPVNEIVKAGRKIVVESYENGRASWYTFGRCLCAAHPFFPKGSYLRVTAVDSGKSVIVVVNDFGPNQSIHPDRLIDLDAEAFKLLAPLGTGTVQVRVEKLKSE